MQTKHLESHEVLDGYDAVSTLYPYTPPLSFWRAWEYASYRHFRLDGRILDVGCGDGRYFRLIWPDASEIVGVDHDPTAVEQGRQSGVYEAVHHAPAHEIPEADASCDHAFANCSLEHMDRLPEVLADIARCLKPGGTLLASVVTNRFIDWSLLPQMVSEAGHPEAAASLHRDFMDFHHLANPLTVEAWAAALRTAGLEPEFHIPILPRYCSGIWLLMDSLWHVRRKSGGEFGEMVHPFLSSNPSFPGAFRDVIGALLKMETDWDDCSGAVFSARKPE